MEDPVDNNQTTRNPFLIPVFALVVVFGLTWFVTTYPVLSLELAAVILFHNPKTVEQIKAEYNLTTSAPLATLAVTPTASTAVLTPKVRILIVPGHEPNYGGAEFQNLKERTMTAELGQDLQQFLNKDPHFQTFITRDTTAYTPTFSTYFTDNWDAINQWQQSAKQETRYLVTAGLEAPLVKIIDHNDAPPAGATRLYGITKWANENNIDITIHIHFNDNPGHSPSNPGRHSGFAIYVPATQYGNSTTTRVIAQSIFNSLSKYTPVSDLPGESTGLVNEPDLIAIGSNNTANAASMLIEYSYIYEPQFLNPQLQSLAIKDLAFQTYRGLENFFNPAAGAALNTVLFPYIWNAPLTDLAAAAPTDVYELQTALITDGEYPPPGKTMNDCPRTGKVGACTRTALAAFQQKHGISGEDNEVGDSTLATLNQLY